MTDHELKKRLQTAFANAAPKTLSDDVIEVCAPCEDEETPRRRKTVLWRPLIAVAAVLVLIVTGVALWPDRTAMPSASMNVLLDVNPSVLLEIDDNENIVAVNALNEDGSTLVGNENWVGNTADAVVHVLVDAMVQNGYLNEKANSVLISVDGIDEERAMAVEQKLVATVQTMLVDEDFEGAVISQTLSADETLKQQAESYGISCGKAMLVQRIIELNPIKTFDDLAPLSINDLNLLCTADQMPNVNSSGIASDKLYISKEYATHIVFAHAAVTANQVEKLETEFDSEDGVMCYEVEFVCGGVEYEYEVDATTGKIRKFETESERDEEDAPVKTTTAVTEITASVETVTTASQSADVRLSEEKVKAIVLSHAGVEAITVMDFEIETDEDGIAVYEVEFRVGDTEYEYCVNAVTGEILESGKETERSNQTATIVTGDTTTSKRTQSTTIKNKTETTCTTTTVTVVAQTTTMTTLNDRRLSKEQVKAIVLLHAGVDEKDVRGYECERNKRNGKDVYEVEFRHGRVEYEYRVDALTGAVLSAETEVGND